MNRLHVGLSFAALLATAVGGVALAAHGSRAAGAYLVALGCFHVVEFLAVWMWRREQLSLQSFAFNGVGHFVALSLGLLEHGAWMSAFGAAPWHDAAAMLGLMMMTSGAFVRVWAMRTAGRFFNHQMQTALGTEHELVQGGPYRWLRHPSYTGFYWFSLGTQVLLGNPITLLLYVGVLGRFFQARVAAEEVALERRFEQGLDPAPALGGQGRASPLKTRPSPAGAASRR